MLSRLRDLKRKVLLDFSEQVPLRFLICQYVINHDNDVTENDLKNWLTNDLGFDEHSVYVTLYRMKGQELGHSPKVLDEKNGRLSLINHVPQFVLIKASFWESWKTIMIPISLLTVLIPLFFPSLVWGQLLFTVALFICVVLWIIDDYLLKRVKFH